MCEQARVTSPGRRIWGLLSTTLGPVFILVMIRRGDVNLTVPKLLLACLLPPIGVIAHELGHALVGRLLGLEIGLITIGYGQVLWRFEVGGTPVQIHAWPVAGVVYLGANTRNWLRTRVWLATFAGPLTTASLMAAAIIWWAELEPVFNWC